MLNVELKHEAFYIVGVVPLAMVLVMVLIMVLIMVLVVLVEIVVRLRRV